MSPVPRRGWVQPLGWAALVGLVLTYASARAQPVPHDASAHMTALAEELGALEVQAARQNDSVKLNYVRALKAQFGALQSVTALAVEALHQAEARGDPATQTAIRARLQKLVAKADALIAAARSAKGEADGARGPRPTPVGDAASPAPGPDGAPGSDGVSAGVLEELAVDEPHPKDVEAARASVTAREATQWPVSPSPISNVVLERPPAASPYQ